MAINQNKAIALFSLIFLYGSTFGMHWLSNVCYPHDALSSSSYENAINARFEEPAMRSLVRKFQPPKKELISLLAEQQKWTASQKTRFNFDAEYYNHLETFPDAKNNKFYLKERFPVCRVVCARKMQNIIASEGYTNIAVPDKYLFLEQNGRRLFSISARVVPTKKKEITIDLKQMIELCDMVFKTRYCDFHQYNFMVDSQDRIVFVDTDIAAFSCGGRLSEHNLKKMRDFFIPADGSDCMLHTVKVVVKPEAQDYLSNKISEYSEGFQSTYRFFPQKSEYDEEDLNISKIYPWIELKYIKKSII